MMDAIDPTVIAETIFGRLSNPSTTFRLVYLQPAPEWSSPIVCKLEHFPINDHPVYEALSWCWGNPALTEEIQLQGQTWLAPTNLVVALRYLRSTSEPRVLWIDALAIKQGIFPSALRERAQQIQLMKSIYTRASRVVVWLGAPSHRVANLLRRFFYGKELLAEELRDKPAETIPPLLELLENGYFERCWVVQELVLCAEVEILCGVLTVALNRLLRELTLYQRFMQEKARSANKVAWHSVLENIITKRFSIFIKLQRTFALKRDCPSQGSSLSVDEIVVPSQTDQCKSIVTANAQEFARLLTHCRYQSTTDPRDKLYSLLGLAAPSISHLLQPSYDEDVAIAYIRTAAAILSESRSLYLLSQTRKLGDSDLRYILPSWVPDWSMIEPLRDAWTSVPAREDRESMFKAGISSQTVDVVFDPPDSLMLKGIMIDKICKKADPLPASYNDLETLHHALGEWAAYADDASLGPYASASEVSRDSTETFNVKNRGLAFPLFPETATKHKEIVFWRVLLHDTLPVSMEELRKSGLASEIRPRGPPAPLRNHFADKSLTWRGCYSWEVSPVAWRPDFVMNSPCRPVDLQDSLIDGRLIELDWKSLALCMGRTETLAIGVQFEKELCEHVKKIASRQVMFVTQDGFLGIGPDYMVETDEVWILDGGTHPFVLRLVDAESMSYELIGECYVSGIMYGEIHGQPLLAYDIRNSPNRPESDLAQQVRTLNKIESFGDSKRSAVAQQWNMIRLQ